MTPEKLKQILEAVLLSADHPMTVIQLDTLFESDEDRPTRDEVRKALSEMEAGYEDSGFELKQVATGYRIQVKQDFAPWVSRLWEEKPAKYTRALLETMALIAYRQPVTRGEIEEVRGVSVSSNIIRTLMERDWIKVLGHKDVPGKPSLYGTTREFLDYFNLKSLDELPSLAELKDLDQVYPELALEADDEVQQDKAPEAANDASADVVEANHAESEGAAETDAADIDDADISEEAAELTESNVDEFDPATQDAEAHDVEASADDESNIESSDDGGNEASNESSSESDIDDEDTQETKAASV